MILQGGRVLVGESLREEKADIRIEDGRIAEVAPGLAPASGEEVLDVRDTWVLPGFVQAHVHTCQTLFRNTADDMELLDWLGERIWPFEAWLDEAALEASSRLGLYELLAGGTTTILDMATVHHTDAVFQAAEDSGIRYVGGKCLMDFDDTGRCPDGLLEEARAALDATERLIARWHGAADGRIAYAIAPRFAVSSTDELLLGVAELAARMGLGVHTHASENVKECEVVRRRTGHENVLFLGKMGLLGPSSVLAHCIHLNDEEIDLLASTGSHVAHCPSSNLKLASGVARVPELLDRGINIALGADGAPCNNRLDAFKEMRLASLIQKPLHGPKTLPARKMLSMATLHGARALGLDAEVGTIDVGKRADLVVIDGASPWMSTGDPLPAIVFACGPESVRDVLVEGRVVKRDFEVLTLPRVRVLRDAQNAFNRLARHFPRIGVQS